MKMPKDLTVKTKDLQKRGLFVASPAFGGMVHTGYHLAMMRLYDLFREHQIPFEYHPLDNDALITRARSSCVKAFEHPSMQKFTNFMFIDTDVTFRPEDVLELFAMQNDNSPFDIIGVAYPRKSLNWEHIRAAALQGVPADKLSEFGADFVVNFERGQQVNGSVFEPQEIPELGTGFMMIRRKTFNVMSLAHPEWVYKPDGMSWDAFNKSTETAVHYWDAPIDPVSKRLLSEDYAFTRAAKVLGLKTWVCPWMTLTHTGKYSYKGSLAGTITLMQEHANARQRSYDGVQEGYSHFGVWS